SSLSLTLSYSLLKDTMYRNIVLSSILLLLIVAGSSQAVSIEPQSVKLAFTNSSSEMRVTWYTTGQGSMPQLLLSGTKFAMDTVNTTTLLASNATSINIGQWSQWTGYINTAVFNKLEGMTTYYYVCGDQASQVWSEVFNFTTGALTHSTVTPFTLAAFGDVGGENGAPTLKNLIATMNNYMFALHVGDIAYADLLTAKALGNQSVWDQWLMDANPITSHLPYMTAIGNHDVFSQEQIYLTSFVMPAAVPNTTWYSFDYNGVHFIAFSYEDNFAVDSPQYQWIHKDLSTFRASNPNGWIVSYAHRPMYCSGIDSWCTGAPRAKFAKVMEDILYTYNVDIYLSGHVHSYERTLPISKNVTMGTYAAPRATIHCVIGMGGNPGGEVAAFSTPAPEWSTGPRINDTGYSTMTFANATHLHWKFFDNANNSLVDSVWIVKGNFSASQPTTTSTSTTSTSSTSTTSTTAPATTTSTSTSTTSTTGPSTTSTTSTTGAPSTSTTSTSTTSTTTPPTATITIGSTTVGSSSKTQSSLLVTIVIAAILS
ncbi:hypothetical protein SAMD00019534_073950, partial [Acytostelium subglobosum LB1]|uniref:hypothetical protein n=1 Tax=Acytostelium subglobosum LB1 TaxID=1410327 RepID=UPI000644A87D